MILEKIAQTSQSLKKSIIETSKLLWSFKWYILVYLMFVIMMFDGYLNPPAKDSPIWGAEATKGDWMYFNQEVYIGSFKQSLISIMLFFFIGTSNMRNHPLLAKIIFLSPLFALIIGLITGTLE